MVDIVIVNWNSDFFLMECVNSLLGSRGESLINKIIIIDNNSTDSSLEQIKIALKNSKIKVCVNEKNLGFSKACNQGFFLCSSEFVLLLNPDAMVLENTLEDCLSFMKSNKEVDVLGCRLLDENGNNTPSCSRFPTPLRFFFDASGLSKLAPSIFTPATLMTDWKHTESKKVDQVMGAFMFMRISIFKKIGYFDERFFVYYEELDFSKRLASAGGVSYYNIKISAIHSGEGTTKSIKAYRLFLNLKSRLQYSKKHFNLPGYLVVWGSTFFIEPFARIFISLLKGKPEEVKEIFKSFLLLIKRKIN